MNTNESNIPSGEVPGETPEQAIESAKIKVAMAEVEAQGTPETGIDVLKQAKTPATITNAKKLKEWTDYEVNVSQDAGGDIKVGIVNREKGKEYSKTGLLPKEKVEAFNKIIDGLNSDFLDFQPGIHRSSVIGFAKKRFKEIEDWLVGVENVDVTSSETPEMPKSVEAVTDVKEVETDKSKYEKRLSEMSGEYDVMETFRYLDPIKGSEILDMMKALKVTPQEVYEACRTELDSVEQRDYWKPPRIITDYLKQLETKRKNQEAAESAKKFSEAETGASQAFFDKFILNNGGLNDKEKEKIKEKVLSEKGFWSLGLVESMTINRYPDNPRIDRLALKSISGSQSYLYLNL